MRLVKMFAVVLTMMVAVSAFADFPWFSNGPKRRIETIIVAGNYKSPRLIAELIQSESRQIYLLFPAKGGEDRVIFCSPKQNKQVLRSKIAIAVRTLNPKRIVILGDERYVSKADAELLGKDIPVVRIECSDWQRVAEELTFMLNLNRLSDDFARLSKQIKSAYRPTAPTPPVTPPEETIVEEKNDEEATADLPVVEPITDEAVVDEK